MAGHTTAGLAASCTFLVGQPGSANSLRLWTKPIGKVAAGLRQVLLQRASRELFIRNALRHIAIYAQTLQDKTHITRSGAAGLLCVLSKSGSGHKISVGSFTASCKHVLVHACALAVFS